MSDFEDFKDKVSSNLKFDIPVGLSLADGELHRLSSSLHSNKHLLSARMFQLSYSSWRTSLVLANAGLSGQVPATLRHSFEAAIYSFLFSRDSEMAAFWVNRHEDDRAAQKFSDRRDGAMARARRLLDDVRPGAKDRLKETQNLLISLGAHPNVLNLAGVSALDSEKEFESYQLQIIGTAEETDGKYVMVGGLFFELSQFYELIWPERVDGHHHARVKEIRGQMNIFARAHFSAH